MVLDLEAALRSLQQSSIRKEKEASQRPLTFFNISTPPPEPEDGTGSGSSTTVEDVPVFDLSSGDGGEDWEDLSAGRSRHNSDGELLVFDISASPGDRERRLLSDVLWTARPGWTPRDLLTSEKKLSKVGVTSVQDLLQELRSGALNNRLRSAALPPFGEGTLQELRRRAESVVEDFERGYLPRARSRADSGTEEFEPSKQRLLCNALWESRPGWLPGDLAAAERKLAQVGVQDLASLDEALRSVTNGLNKRLREAKMKTFSSETIAALRRRLDEIYGRADSEDKQAAWMGSNAQVCDFALRDILWESRPTWSAADLSAAEMKLAEVGVFDVPGLSEALSNGLNQKLKAAGLKAFSAETMKELRRRVSAAVR